MLEADCYENVTDLMWSENYKLTLEFLSEDEYEKRINKEEE